MGLSNRMQAFLVGASSFCLALGTAGATLPNFVPEQYKAPFAMFFWLSGIVGFALKEALGSQVPAGA